MTVPTETLDVALVVTAVVVTELEPAVVVTATDVELEPAAALVVAEVAELALAKIDEHSACASERTTRASVAPQELMTQVVAAAWMAAALAAWHWQAKSVPQVVAEAAASVIHVVAQAGICADAKLAKAMRPMTAAVYFILAV